jgi:hypothetical protein
MLARGLGHDGRTLFSIMPYTQYRSMSDEDLASTVVCLRTLVTHRVDSTLPATTRPVCGGTHGDAI